LCHVMILMRCGGHRSPVFQTKVLQAQQVHRCRT
jgi:hypothetical protein